MKSWKKEDLENIVEEDDLHIAPYRSDGETYGTPTWIWCVSVDDRLYVRAYNGPNSRWYQSAMEQKAGKIEALEQDWEVTFAPVEDEQLKDRIDDAYREKYEGSQYLSPMLSERAREATVHVAWAETRG